MCREGAAEYRYKRSRLTPGDIPQPQTQPPPKKARIEPETGAGRKYATYSRVAAYLIPEHHGTVGMHQLLAAAFANSTWAKHESACNSFHCFENYSGTNMKWPSHMVT